MSFCVSCGRKIEHDCSCLNSGSIKRYEAFILLVLLIASPIFLISNSMNTTSIYEINYILIGNKILVGILMILTLLNLILKKPYLALFFGCHQKVNHSLSIWGKILPICTRCLGIYFGVMLSFLLSINQVPFYVYLILGIPLIIDGLLQQYKDIESTHLRRLITGLLFGPTLVFIYSLYNYMMFLVMTFIFQK